MQLVVLLVRFFHLEDKWFVIFNLTQLTACSYVSNILTVSFDQLTIIKFVTKSLKGFRKGRC